MVQDLIPQYYFHCTQSRELIDKKVTLYPRGEGRNWAESEPDIPRICVCPKVSACLAAVSVVWGNDVRVYRAFTCAWTPFNVFDSHITGEKWILEPTEFELIDVLDAYRVNFRDNSYCRHHIRSMPSIIAHNRRILTDRKALRDCA